MRRQLEAAAMAEVIAFGPGMAWMSARPIQTNPGETALDRRRSARPKTQRASSWHANEWSRCGKRPRPDV